MATQNDSGTSSFTAAAAIPQFARVKLNGSAKIAKCAAVDACIGVTQKEAFADGDVIPVRMLSHGGTFKMIAASAISEMAVIFGAADGEINDDKVGIGIGLALEAAAADQDIIECVFAPMAAPAATHLIDATDQASNTTRINAVLVILEDNGLMKDT